MARVVVVGAGLAGLATAARLAKLGHQVTVLDAATGPTGLLERVTVGDCTWDAAPRAVTLPAVVRDLFRKSGRPLERLVDLRLSTPMRRHVFADGVVLDLPGGSRGAQTAAVSAALGGAAGVAWTAFVDRQGDVWHALRTEVLDPPEGLRSVEPALAATLDPRGGLERLLRRSLPDPRLRMMARHAACGIDLDPTLAPAFAAARTAVERTFGGWQPAGETTAEALCRALLTRLDERGVDLRFETPMLGPGATGTAGSDHRIVTPDGVLTADIVVLDPFEAPAPPQTAPPSRRRWSRRAPEPARGASVTTTCLALRPPASGGADPLLRTALLMPPAADAETDGASAETVLHGDETVTVWSRTTPDGSVLLTISHRSDRSDDRASLGLLLAHGIDVRDRVAARTDRVRSAAPGWRGFRAVADDVARARPGNGVFSLGTHAILGPEIPYVAWESAHLADLVGKA